MNDIRKLVPRFSIRTLILTHSMIAVALAVFVVRILLPYQWESARIANIRASSPSAQLYTQPRGQYLFRHCFGDRYSHRLVSVHLKDPHIDDQWIEDHLSDLKFIEALAIKSTSVTDRSVKRLGESLPELGRLLLTNTRVSDHAITELRKKRPRGRFIVQTQ